MRSFIALLLTLILAGCGGGDPPYFPGEWQGTFSDISNQCPFSVREEMNELYPMTISEAGDGTLTVVANDGSIAVGRRGDGESISFSAESAVFGDYGEIAPYLCTSSARIGYLGAGDDQARVSLVILFLGCSDPVEPDESFDCAVTYSGDAVKTN